MDNAITNSKVKSSLITVRISELLAGHWQRKGRKNKYGAS